MRPAASRAGSRFHPPRSRRCQLLILPLMSSAAPAGILKAFGCVVSRLWLRHVVRVITACGRGSLSAPDPAPIGRIAILKSNCADGAALCRHVQAAHPQAHCTVVRTIAEAERSLATGAPDLFITGLDASDGDPLDLLWRATAAPRAVRHSFVVTRHREPWLLAAGTRLPVMYFGLKPGIKGTPTKTTRPTSSSFPPPWQPLLRRLRAVTRPAVRLAANFPATPRRQLAPCR